MTTMSSPRSPAGWRGHHAPARLAEGLLFTVLLLLLLLGAFLAALLTGQHIDVSRVPYLCQIGLCG